jgi:hypothetical protein
MYPFRANQVNGNWIKILNENRIGGDTEDIKICLKSKSFPIRVKMDGLF